MGWQDRNYNSGGGPGDNYLANPLGLFNFSIPFGTWFGARVRLHFWLLLTFLFVFVGNARGGDFLTPVVICALLIVALMAHEFGHRFLARRMGGSHNEFMLWPAGGLIPPNAPPFPWPFFVTHAGGIIVNLILAIVCETAVFLISHTFSVWSLFALPGVAHATPALVVLSCLMLFGTINFALVLANFLPYYWFDGGPLLQSILWPFVKLYQAINVTCIVGMVLAVPMFFLSLLAGLGGLMGMIYWAMLFASSYTKRKQLKAAGTQEMEEAIAWSANYGGDVSGEGRERRKKAKKYSTNSARKKIDAERAEQEKIDAILVKVKEKGLHSLTWLEKRTLKKATERQRERDVARRR